MLIHTRIAVRHKSFWLAIALILLLSLTLTACGTNASNTGSAPGGSTPTPAPTATQSQAQVDGCPNKAVVTTQPAAASLVLKGTNSNSTVSAKKGDTIEIDLAFGHTWQGPLNASHGLLTMQNPSGYASPTAKACVWRFVASQTGTAQLSFSGRPLCEKDQLCPQYVMAVDFTINIK
ncbi:MAG TPA: hypothetical protein VFV38_08300 [Ktedonobacteraceae bacterium]|nr:hypothetical protein [Ktedonobacteraceae bacterium]